MIDLIHTDSLQYMNGTVLSFIISVLVIEASSFFVLSALNHVSQNIVNQYDDGVSLRLRVLNSIGSSISNWVSLSIL